MILFAVRDKIMKNLSFLVWLVFATSSAFGLSEKLIRPVGIISERCLNNKGCGFFKCFEKRFPCGKDYWIMKWGVKYCNKYANPTSYNSFTPEGQSMLNFTNTCHRKFFEKQYRSEKPMRCKRFFDQAINAQGKCYANLGDTFCKVFPQNKNQFMGTMDRDDYMNTNFITMVTDRLSSCNPPISLFTLMFSWDHWKMSLFNIFRINSMFLDSFFHDQKLFFFNFN